MPCQLGDGYVGTFGATSGEDEIRSSGERPTAELSGHSGVSYEFSKREIVFIYILATKTYLTAVEKNREKLGKCR